MNTWRRKILALLSVPLLAVPSAAGVYLWLVPHIGAFFAGLTAAGFESLYIGINVLIITTPELRRYARNVALSGVATAVIFNTLARYQAMVGGDLRAVAIDGVALGLAVLESIPLAGLAYAISVLLHRLSEASAEPLRPIVSAHRARLARSLWRLRSEARSSRAARASEASSSVMLAQARADLESVRAMLVSQGNELAQAMGETVEARGQTADARADLARRDGELAQLREQLAQAANQEAQTRADLATAHAELEPMRERLAGLEPTAASLGKSLEEARAELRTVRDEARKLAHEAAALRDRPAPMPPSRQQVIAYARGALASGRSLLSVADELHYNESTLRTWLNAATNGHAIEA